MKSPEAGDDGAATEGVADTLVERTRIGRAAPPLADSASPVTPRPHAEPRSTGTRPPSLGGGTSAESSARLSTGKFRPLATQETTGPMTRVEAGPLGHVERYLIGDRIGVGGMGEVLAGFDDRIGRDVAIKRMRAGAPTDDQHERFLREAQVQGRLEHPAIVPVHDILYDEHGAPLFVMKRLTGETMADILSRDLRAEPGGPAALAARPRLLRAFVDVCLAIEFAHQRGVVHRDLKPANIMLGDFGEVYVLDWGVARSAGESEAAVGGDEGRVTSIHAASSHTEAGAVLGTPGYMAPEQVSGTGVGPAADIYALGCMLYEIVAGRSLHGRGLEALATTLEEVDARPSLRWPDAPPELEVACVRATRLDPAARYPTARELATAVQNYLDGDRDVAMRRELATQAVLRAQQALRTNDEAARRTAMREAGRALALDPTNADAAHLVTRMMLEPPAVVPPEVQAELAALDLSTARAHTRLSVLAMLAYLAFVPCMLWIGVRSWVGLGAYIGAISVSAFSLWAMSRASELSPRAIYSNVTLHAVLLGVVSYMFGPFFAVPALLMVRQVSYAAHPRLGNVKWVAVLLGLGVALPWVASLVGVTPMTYAIEDGMIALRSPVLHYTDLPVQVSYAAFLVAVLVVVSYLSRSLAVNQRRATKQLELQAWQLRQLLPDADESRAMPRSG